MCASTPGPTHCSANGTTITSRVHAGKITTYVGACTGEALTDNTYTCGAGTFETQTACLANTETLFGIGYQATWSSATSTAIAAAAVVASVVAYAL